MVVSVNFFGLQRKMTQIDQIQVSLLNGKRVTDLMQYIKKQFPDLLLNEEAVLVTVNNRVSSTKHLLEADDQISFVPHIGGG